MREEIEAAVHFVGRVIISSYSESISSFSEFKSELSKVMEERFKGHWHDESPGKGSAYRSIRIHPTDAVDPVLKQAAVKSKFSITYLRIPVELTMWVDPKDVTCRFGDLKSTYCTVLKDEDNQASTLDVDELLENAKALYTRQHNVVIVDGPQPSDLLFMSPANSNNDLYSYGMQMNGFTDNYLFPPYGMYSPWHPDGGMTDGSTPPPLPYGPMAVSTTPRKNGKNHFRKGSNGTGRGSKHHHHHQHHNGGDIGSPSNQNHINNNHNSNTSGNTPNGSISNGRGFAGGRFQWVKGTKNFQQFYSLPPQNHSYGQMQQQKHHQLEAPQTPPKKRQNSESDKDAK